jgi:hypothetical protein
MAKLAQAKPRRNIAVGSILEIVVTEHRINGITTTVDVASKSVLAGSHSKTSSMTWGADLQTNILSTE